MIPDVMSRDERIAEFTKRQPGAGTDDQTLAECDVCGFLEWQCSRPPVVDVPPKVHVERMDGGRCPRCASVQMRSPEVYAWVLSALVKHEQGGGHAA